MKTHKLFHFLITVILVFTFGSCKEKYEFTLQKDLRSDLSQIAFSPDGKFMARGYFTLKIFETGQDSVPVKTFTDYKNIIEEIEFSPDGNLLAIVSDTSVYLYDVNNDFSLKKQLTGTKFSFSKDGKLITTVNDKKISVYKTDDFSEQKTLDLKKDIIKTQFTNDGKYLFAADSNKIYVYSLPDYQELKGLKFFKYKITDFDLNPDNQTVAIGFEDKIYIYTFKDGKFSFKTQVASFFTKIKSLKYSPDGDYLFVNEENSAEIPQEHLAIYRIENGKKYILQTFIQCGTLYDFSFADNDRFVVVSPKGIDFYKLDFENASEKFLPFTEINYEFWTEIEYDEEGNYIGSKDYIEGKQPNFINYKITFDRKYQTLFMPTEDRLFCYRYYYSRLNFYCVLNNVNAFALFHTKKYVAVANDSLRRIEIYKLGFKPQLVSYLTFPDYKPQEYDRKMQITYDDMFLFFENDDKILVIELSDLQNPEIVDEFGGTNLKISKNYFLAGDRIYKFDNPDSVCYYVDSLYIYELSFSPDEKYLIGENYAKAKIWSLNDDGLELVKTLTKPAFAFSEDGKYFIDVEDDEGIANIFKTDNLKEPVKKIRIDGEIMKIFTSGRYLGISFYNNESGNYEETYHLAVFDIKRNFKLVDTISHPYPEKFISAGYGKLFFIIGEEEECEASFTTYSFYLKTKVLEPYKKIINEPSPEFIFTKSGKYLLTREINSQENYTKISVIDLPSFETVKSLTLKNKKIGRIFTSPKNSFFLFYGDSYLLEIYSNDKKLQQLKQINNVEKFVFSNNEKYLVVLDTSAGLQIYDTKNFQLIKRLYPNHSLLRFSDKDKYLMTFNYSGTGNLYDTKKDFKLAAEIDYPYSLKFFDDDKKFVTKSTGDQLLIIGKITPDGTEDIKTIYLDDVYSAKVFPLGKEKIVVTTNSKVKVYNLKNYEVIFQADQPRYFNITFDRDKNYILTFSDEKKVFNVYSVKDNFEQILSLQAKISDVVFSPDNKLAFAYGGSTLYILSTGENFKVLKKIDKKANIDAVVISPDTKYFVVETEYGPMVYKI